MPHDTPLLETIIVGLTLAFALGAVANRLRVSPIVGYLLAGIAIGPHTPGFIANQNYANELAELGIILLMFGVGLHFSPKDLLSVRGIAIPGALAQVAAATAMGAALGIAMGWPLAAGFIFGLALSVASTVVLLRALQERRLISTERGRIAVGWLIVEDLVMVIALVLLPTLAPLMGGAQGAPAGGLTETIGVTILKFCAFVAIMLLLGRRFIPWLLHLIAQSGSRELFRLGVLAVALGVAFGSAKLFGVSFALGAFFAGMILSESELSQQAASETLPLRDAFAVLFFVSVGMLFDPAILVRDAALVVATLLIIVVGKSLAALGIVLLFRYPALTAFTIAASLAQIGEFSFILAALGVKLELLPERARDLILAGAILSIMLNPLIFFAVDRFGPRLAGPRAETAAREDADARAEQAARELDGHVILFGYGRVGRRVGEALRQAGGRVVVIDEKDDVVERVRAEGGTAIAGMAPAALQSANVAAAATLIVAVPNCFEAGQIVSQARALNPGLRIITRAHSDAESAHLREQGADEIVLGEKEIAEALAAAYAGSPAMPGGREAATA